MELFNLSLKQAESLVNKARLSLFSIKMTRRAQVDSQDNLKILLKNCGSRKRKQLQSYGYCLSDSLANDAVVRWFMENDNREAGAELLYSINETLALLDLPLLLTKQINR